MLNLEIKDRPVFGDPHFGLIVWVSGIVYVNEPPFICLKGLKCKLLGDNEIGVDHDDIEVIDWNPVPIYSINNCQRIFTKTELERMPHLRDRND